MEGGDPSHLHSQDMDNAKQSSTNSGVSAAKEFPTTIAVLKKIQSAHMAVAHDFEMSDMPNEPLRYSEESAECEEASTSNLVSLNSLENQSHWKGFVNMLKKGPKQIHFVFSPLTFTKLSRRKSRSARGNMMPLLPAFDHDMYCIKSTWKNFSIKELHEATKNFSPETLIGKGGYAEVYKGTLPDGRLVAIKRMTKGDVEEMAADFLCELGIIVHVNHPNIANVIGYGVEGGLHLVLPLSPNGSVETLLRGPDNSRKALPWNIRYKIALGSAEGLQYLHEGCQRRIIHRDIKSANILLSEEFDPQICDFGLAKWLPEQWTHHTVSKIEGTFGYLPPEFFMHGIVDEKTDVYAYGVLLLELITGRLALDNPQQSLVMWAKPLADKNNFKDLIDPILGNAYDLNQMKLMVLTASMCIHQSSIQRPQMSQVVEILRGQNDYEKLVKQTKRPSLKRTYSVELDDAEEYNSTKYLSDVDQLMQFAMEI